MPANPGTTNPLLLLRLADWRDHPAWGEFVARYAPLVRSRCRRFHLDAEASEDACQRIWIGLSHRLLGFRYDPNGSFRSWLRRYCDSRLIDQLRGQESARDIPIDDAFGPEGPPARSTEDATDDDDTPAAQRAWLLTLAAEIHEQVRLQVNPETWRAFWLVAVEDRSIREAAETLGKTYAATFAAQKRVRQMLREEGRKVLEGSREPGFAPRSDGALRGPFELGD